MTGESRLVDFLSCRRALEAARDTFDRQKWAQLARTCCLRPTPDTSRREAALALADKADLFGLARKNADLRFGVKLTVGMAEYRSGHFAEADEALIAEANAALAAGKFGFTQVVGDTVVGDTAAFYRAMSLFRQGKENEARKLAAEAAARMKPLPKDEKNPLADGATPDDLIRWLAYKEAKALIGFDAAPTAPPQEKK